MGVEPRWLTFEDVELIHADQLERYSGTAGTKDNHLVHSALASPQFQYEYAGERDLLALAVDLCFKIAKNHGYVDGNKRTATAAMIAFLQLNGFDLHMVDMDGYEPLAELVEQLAADELTPERFADEIYPNVYPL